MKDRQLLPIRISEEEIKELQYIAQYEGDTLQSLYMKVVRKIIKRYHGKVNTAYRAHALCHRR